jgi:hypothetical protein
MRLLMHDGKMIMNIPRRLSRKGPVRIKKNMKGRPSLERRQKPGALDM